MQGIWLTTSADTNAHAHGMEHDTKHAGHLARHRRRDTRCSALRSVSTVACVQLQLDKPTGVGMGKR